MPSTMDTDTPAAATPDERIAEPASPLAPPSDECGGSPGAPVAVDAPAKAEDKRPDSTEASPDVPAEEADADADVPGAVDTSADEVDDDEDENSDEKAGSDEKEASGNKDASGNEPWEDVAVSEEAYAAFERSLGIEPEAELEAVAPVEEEEDSDGDDDSETGFVKFELLMGCLKDKAEDEGEEVDDKNQSGEEGDPLDELEQFMDALEDRDPADDSSEDEFDREAADLVSYVDFMTALRSKARAQLAARRTGAGGGDAEFSAFLRRLEGNDSEDVFYDAVDGNDDEFAAFLASLTSPTTEDPADYTSPEDLVWSQILEGMPPTDRVGFVGWLLGAEPDKPVITMAEGDRILWLEQSWGGCLRAWFGAAVAGPQEEEVVAAESEVDRELDEKRRGEGAKTRIEVVRAEEDPAAEVPAEIV